MKTWREDVITALESQGGVANLADIYRIVKSYRNTVPKSYDAIIRRTLESASSDSHAWDKKNDIFYSADGIGEGVWGLRSNQKETPNATDINEPENISGGSRQPGRSAIQTYRVIRDTKLCRDIKKLHQHKCQFCSSTIELPSGEKYSEAHHIIPLGAPHHGPDTAENIIVVCPNHHAMLDYGVIKLNPLEVTLHPKHKISAQSVEYHNSHIYKLVAHTS